MPVQKRYAAFLRGINVGGNKKVPMADLKKALEKAGFAHVKTLLNSGNVLLDSSLDPRKIGKEIEAVIQKAFGFPSSVIIRSVEDLLKLQASQPFKGIPVTKDTRLYVTFLSGKPESGLKIPYVSPDGSFRILSVSETEICSVLTLMPDARTPEAMGILEKEYGKTITTRNWNTLEKMLK